MGSYQRATDVFDIESEAEDRLFLSGVEKTKAGRSQYEQREKRRKLLVIAAWTTAGIAALAIIIAVAVVIHRRKIDYRCLKDFDRGDEDVVFFVVGDWGRGASKTQMLAAKMMGEIGECMTPDFVISTGDNFYEHGLKTQNDPFFTHTFTNVYTDSSLQKPWYSILGNHDYGELKDQALLTSCASQQLDTCPAGCCYSAKWQVGSSSPQTGLAQLDWRWTLKQGAWRQSFASGLLDIIFIDTTPMVSKYQDLAWAKSYGGISSQNPEAQKDEVRQLLNSSTAAWKLVVGHHPVFSYGSHCADVDVGEQSDCDDMQWLRKPMKAAKVAAYLCGHEHDLQLIRREDDGISYIVSGAGSDVRSGEFDEAHKPSDLDFFADHQGFVAIAIKGDVLTAYFYTSKRSQPSYIVSIPRPR